MIRRVLALLRCYSMRASRTLLPMLVIAWVGLHSADTVAAGPIFSGWGTPNANGIFALNEWSSAGTATFNANTPGGGTTLATLYVMNDASNIYLAVQYARSPGDTTSLSVYFDKDYDNARSVGDDVILLTNPTTFFDAIVEPCCGGNAINGQSDTDFGGTFDGGGAFSNSGTFSVHEMWHPLKSSDAAHDIQISAGQTIGVLLDLRIIVPPGVFPQDYGDTAFGFVPVITSAGPLASAQIPVLSGWGLVVLTVLMGLAFAVMTRRME